MSVFEGRNEEMQEQPVNHNRKILDAMEKIT